MFAYSCRMMNTLIRITVLTALLGTGTASAEPAWVSDQFEITLRSGPSTSNAIQLMVDSGTRLEVLERDADSGYARVQTQAGTEGWVLTRYLMSEPAARERIAAQADRLAALDEENRQLKQELAALTQERDTVTGARGQLEDENARLSQELASIKRAAADVLSIDAENQQLKGRVASLERELLTLQEQNTALSDRTARDWFMVGAGVVLLGILIGLIIPKIRWRRKQRWDVL